MPEGLSPSEVGKELAEHRHKAEEKEKEQGEAAEAKGRERWLTITEAILLAVVAVLAAWSGFASAKWSTHSSLDLAKASAARTEANRYAYQAADLKNFDSLTFNAWFTAYVAHNKPAMRVAEDRFRPVFLTAFKAWLTTDPFTNPNAPKGPTYMPQYKQPELDLSNALDKKADLYYALGEEAGGNADSYVADHGVPGDRAVPGGYQRPLQGPHGTPRADQHRRGHPGVRVHLADPRPETTGMRPVDPRLLRHARAARGYLIFTVGLGLVVTALVLAQAGLLAHVLATAARGTGTAALWPALAVLLAVVAARAVAAGGGETVALRAAATVKSQLRRQLTAHTLRLGPAWLGGQQTGEIATLATKGLDALDPYFARYLPQLVLAVAVPVAVVARVAAADWISAVVIAVTLPLIPVFAVLVGLHTKARTQRQWRLLASLGGHFLDVVEGLPTLKLFGRAQAQAQVIGEVSEAHRKATMGTLRVAFLSALVLELAAALATALVAVEVGLRLLAGHLGYQTALLVLLLTPEAYLPLRAVGAQFHASMEGTTAAARACDILDTAPPGPAAAGSRLRPGGPVPADLRSSEIMLNEACVAYPGRDGLALDRVSLVIGPGERITVTGPSGSGKSTLLALLLRFAEPTAGTIEADGVPLAELDLAAWRAQIAWVPQRPHLFAGTVAGNIALGQPDASREAIEHAAALAGAAEFIKALPAGLDTELGERAGRLSAGERQRIALARAFLRDAPLLLLDEPTAHLDAITAAEILATVETLMAHRTVVLVSHGPGWAGPADQTITLHHGRMPAVATP